MTAGVPAREYHERTKHSPRSVRADEFRLDFDDKPTPDKAYVDLPRVPLASSLRPAPVPALRAIADRAPKPDGAPDLEQLTQLCYYAAGITRTVRRGERELAFRAASCTGALYHVDLYVVCGDLDGLDAGVYHFDPTTLSLDVLRAGDYRGVLADATGAEPAVSRAPVTVVATSTWWRNAWKYRERTYRHAFWDSGTVLANLVSVARSLDLPARAVLGFADGRVADLLGLDPSHEAPVELVAVGRDEPVPDAPAVDRIRPTTRPLSDHERSYDLIEAAYAASSLPDGGAAREWRGSGPHGTGVGRRPSGDGERFALAPVTDARASKAPLSHTIERRGSCRSYERTTLNFRKVSTVLDRATRGFDADVRDPTGTALQFTDAYLLVHDVAGLSSGVYQYHPATREVELLRAGGFRQQAGHLALDQRLAADAGLCVFFLADLDAVVARFGDRGYRAAQFEAAFTAGLLYLAAYAHRDLGATGLTFYDDAVTSFFEPRAAGQTPMFLFTLGRPA